MNEKYLYHYTTIETLELILRNKTIRFNSLSNVDDLEECKAKDLESIGKYCFVSCWSAAEKESIALWQMYSENCTGVRIRLPINPFKKYTRSEKMMEPGYNGELIVSETGRTYTSIFEDDFLVGDQCFPICKESDFLLPVKYTDNKDLLLPNILINDGSEIDMTRVGIYKNTHWKFQDEWRYRFIVYPLGIKEMKELWQGGRYAINKMKDQIDLPITSFDLKIDDDSFKDMQIELGPNTLISDKIIVESLIASLNPSAKIVHSELTGKIRAK